MASPHRDLASASLGRLTSSVAVAGIGVRLFALINEPLLARSFGTSGELDAFLLAFLVPTFLIAIVGNAFAGAFVPAFIAERATSGEAAAFGMFRAAVWRSMAWMLAGTTVAALFLWFGVALVMPNAPGLHGLPQRLGAVLLPTVVIKGWASSRVALLHAHGRFAFPSWSRITTPVALLLGLLLFVPDYGVFVLAWATLLGTVIEALLLGVGARPHRSVRSDGFSRHRLGQAYSQYGALLAGSALASGAVIVDRTMVAGLAVGALATYYFGQRIVDAGVGIGVEALGSVMLPVLSTTVVEDGPAVASAQARRWALFVGLGASLLVLIAFPLAQPLVVFAFERGLFDGSDSVAVAEILQVLSLSLPPALVATVLSRWFSAVGRNGFLAWIGLASLPANALLNWASISTFGLVGVAWSTVVVFSLTAAAMWIGSGSGVSRTNE